MLRSQLVLATAALALACLASTDGFARGSFVQADKLVIALQPPAPRHAPPQRPPSTSNNKAIIFVGGDHYRVR